MSIRKLPLVLFTACVFAVPAPAALLVYSDQSTFLSATGAAAAHTPFADIGSVATPYVRDSLTFDLGPGATQLFSGLGPGDWSSLIPGSELALSSSEDLDVSIASAVFSFGFQFHEPSASRPAGTPVIDTCNLTSACTDSTFVVTLFSGAANVGGFSFNVLDDTLGFVGVWSDVAFDRVEIRETVGTNDNEFFGQFYTGQTAPVPEPSSWILFGAGLAALAVVRRRRSH